ncbi:hypothetical protein ACP6C7_29110 [Mycolicibacterium septicum]|uniref:DNA-binding protein n=1 Tax=Mycolicibacterium septicum TaxID=98668 RepID=A0ABW9M0E1_9MYCO
MSCYYVHPLDSPTLLDQAAVLDFVAKDVGLSMITPTRIKDAVRAKTLKPCKISGTNRFTRRNVLEWLESLGVVVDWDAADALAKRESAAQILAETDAALAELS